MQILSHTYVSNQVAADLSNANLFNKTCHVYLSQVLAVSNSFYEVSGDVIRRKKGTDLGGLHKLIV